jgi:SAM-dependent methyltransferase
MSCLAVADRQTKGEYFISMAH